MNKVKDVISENEALIEQTKQGAITSDTSDSGSNDFNYNSGPKQHHAKVQLLSGPNIVFESRISELEAQLAQAEIDIKKLTEENKSNKEKLASGSNTNAPSLYNRKVENLER